MIYWTESVINRIIKHKHYWETWVPKWLFLGRHLIKLNLVQELKQYNLNIVTELIAGVQFTKRYKWKKSETTFFG
jgi:hypothetical protein